jgi:hypothetical protein
MLRRLRCLVNHSGAVQLTVEKPEPCSHTRRECKQRPDDLLKSVSVGWGDFEK